MTFSVLKQMVSDIAPHAVPVRTESLKFRPFVGLKELCLQTLISSLISRPTTSLLVPFDTLKGSR